MKPEPCHLQNTPPAAPDLVLRVGFAGKRDMDPAAHDILHSSLTEVFSIIGRCLVEIAPGDEVRNPSSVPAIANCYSPKDPVPRLVNGLCEGADTVAFHALEQLEVSRLGKDFSAVVPFDLASYRASRRPEHFGEFDRQAAKCSSIVLADGIYDIQDAAMALRRWCWPTVAGLARTAASRR